MARYLFTLVFIVASSSLMAAGKNPPPTYYRLGVFPYMSPRQTVELFGPVVTAFESVLKRPVHLESAMTFPDFGHNLKEQNYDIALIQPFDYHKAVVLGGYLPLARLDAPLVTQLMVRDDSRYVNISDLRGTTIGLPPTESANARMTLRALYDNKLVVGRDIQIQYFKSHDSCIQQVWIGEISACGTSKTPVLVFEQRMQAKLRPIYNTPAIPHTLFVVHTRVPAIERNKLQQLIIGWKNTDDGRTLLKMLGLPGFIHAKPSDYDVMTNYEPQSAAPKPEHDLSQELVLGVLPYITPRMLTEKFSIALSALSKKVKNTIHLRSATSYENFTEAVNSESYDLVLVQPFEYINATMHGYLPLVSMKEKIKTSFYVLSTSPYKQLSELKGTVIAMPPIKAAQSRMGRKELSNIGLVPGRDIDVVYSINHEACLQRVQSGEATACVTGEIALSLLSREITGSFRSIANCPEVPGLVLLAHKRLPIFIREQFISEIVGWKNTAAGKKILDLIHIGEFIPVNTDEYTNLSKNE